MAGQVGSGKGPIDRLSRRDFAARVGVLAGGVAAGGMLRPHAAVAAQEASPTPKHGGVLKYALNTDPPKLDPAASGPTGAIDMVCSMVYSRLVNYTPDSSGVVPDLAERWEVSEDGTSYTFFLRQGVKWHDGTDFSAEDVKFSFERLLDPATAAPYAPNFGKGVTVEAVDPATVRFSLPTPNAAFLALLAVPPASIVSKAFVEEGNNLADAMMGTGPFTFADRQPSVNLRLVRNESYYVPERPYLDGITFLFFPDETARVTALRTNAVDFMDFVPQAEQSALEETEGMVLYSDKETSLFQFAMRQDRPPLGEVKVRQALSCAVDREAALQAALFGRGAVVTGGPLWASSWAYSPDVKQIYTYDPERGRQLLAEAGYPDGFKTTILSNTSFAMHQNTAVTVQAGFREIGVDAELTLFDFPTAKQKTVQGDFDIVVETVIPTYADPDFLWSFFHSQSLWGQNLKLNDPDVDAWLDQARASTDREERKQLYTQVLQRLMETVPMVFLMTRETADAAWSYVKDYIHFPGLAWSGERAFEWWLDK
jgi:peptide/nickel transport system substrate-binding protein